MRRLVTALFGFFFLLFGEATAKEACTKEQALAVADSTVSISRVMPDGRLVGGSAWRFDKGRLATVGHLADDLELSGEWQPLIISISDREYGKAQAVLITEARVVMRNNEAPEEGAVLMEIADILPGVISMPERRFTPLNRDEPVLTVAYPALRLRIATGKFSIPETSPEAEPSEEEPSHLWRFILADEDRPDERALGPGASGAPIFDCDGRVVASIATLPEQNPVQERGFRSMASWLRLNNFAEDNGLGPMLEHMESILNEVHGLPTSYFEN